MKLHVMRRVLLIIFTYFIYSSCFANITFDVTHKLDPSYEHVAPDFLPYMSVRIEKMHGAHSTQILNLPPGQTGSSYTQSTWLFAPDPSGEYRIAIDCLGYQKDQPCSSGYKTISVQDGSSVQINATCSAVKDSYGIARSFSVPVLTIKVDNKFVVGSADALSPIDGGYAGYWKQFRPSKSKECIARLY